MSGGASPSVLVIGAGVIGASIARHLALGGARVTILDDGAPETRATRASFAWINSGSGWDSDYHALRMRSLALWRELAAAPGVPARLSGGLAWEATTAETEAMAEEFGRRGYPHRVISGAEAKALEPALGATPELVVEATAEGVVDPDGVAAAMLDGVGATLRSGLRVSRLLTEGGRVVGAETPEGPVRADHVVVACGLGSPALIEPLGVAMPMSGRPGLMMRFRAIPQRIERVVCAPGLHVWQLEDGRLIAAEDFAGSDGEVDPALAAETVRKAAEALLPSCGPLELDEIRLGRRPEPGDGRPILGAIPGVEGVSVATSHSGVSLAPIFGALLARLILEGEADPALALYSVERFAGA